VTEEDKRKEYHFSPWGIDYRRVGRTEIEKYRVLLVVNWETTSPRWSSLATMLLLERFVSRWCTPILQSSSQQSAEERKGIA